MSADLLRRAAARARELAEGADEWSRGRWQAEKVYDESYTIFPVQVMDWDYDSSADADYKGCRLHQPEAEHAATWDPTVALAVAELLDEIAEDWRTEARPQSTEDAALDVARALLREAS